MGARRLSYSFIPSIRGFKKINSVHTGLPNKHESSNEFCYGFNGMEKDDEITGVEGSHLDFGDRIYDSRVGRWLSVDVLEVKNPEYSSYKSLRNNPVVFIDPNGNSANIYERAIEITDGLEHTSEDLEGAKKTGGEKTKSEKVNANNDSNKNKDTTITICTITQKKVLHIL